MGHYFWTYRKYYIKSHNIKIEKTSKKPIYLIVIIDIQILRPTVHLSVSGAGVSVGRVRHSLASLLSEN